MWIFTNKGPISITASMTGSSLHLKARRRTDLEAVVGNESVLEKEGDYPFHATIERSDFKEWLLAEVDQIDYTNFKGSLSSELYAPYLRIWFVLLESFGGFGRK